jgi:hypothetical protein
MRGRDDPLLEGCQVDVFLKDIDLPLPELSERATSLLLAFGIGLRPRLILEKETTWRYDSAPYALDRHPTYMLVGMVD